MRIVGTTKASDRVKIVNVSVVYNQSGMIFSPKKKKKIVCDSHDPFICRISKKVLELPYFF